MPFPNRAQQPAQAGAVPPPPPPPTYQAAPPPPPPPPPADVQVHVLDNGAQTTMSVGQTAGYPGNTPAWAPGMPAWGTLDDVRRQFGTPQPQQQTLPFAGQQTSHSGCPYSGAQTAAVGFARNPYLTPGRYALVITHSEYKVGRKGNGQVFEGVVLASDVLAASEIQPVSAGTMVSIYCKNNDSFLGNMKEIALAASGYNPQDPANAAKLSDAEIGSMLDGVAPGIIGCLLYVEAQDIITKENKPFTRHHYWPCPSTGQVDAKGYPIPDLDNLDR